MSATENRVIGSHRRHWQKHRPGARLARFEFLEGREMLSVSPLGDLGMAGPNDLVYVAAASGTQLAALPDISPYKPALAWGNPTGRNFRDIAAVGDWMYGVVNGAQYSELWAISLNAPASSWTFKTTFSGYVNLNAMDARGTDTLYLAGSHNSSLLEYHIAANTWNRVGTIELLGSSGGDLAYHAGENRIHYVDTSNRLCWYDLDNNQNVRLSAIGTDVFALDWDVAGQNLFAVSNPSGAPIELLRVDPGTAATTLLATYPEAQYSYMHPVWGMTIVSKGVGVLVIPTSLQTSESGTSATFTIEMVSQPLADVTIGFSGVDASEGTLTYAPGATIFTPADWGRHTFTVTGVDDSVEDGDVTYFIHSAASSTDPRYNGLPGGDGYGRQPRQRPHCAKRFAAGLRRRRGLVLERGGGVGVRPRRQSEHDGGRRLRRQRPRRRGNLLWRRGGDLDPLRRRSMGVSPLGRRDVDDRRRHER